MWWGRGVINDVGDKMLSHYGLRTLNSTWIHSTFRARTVIKFSVVVGMKLIFLKIALRKLVLHLSGQGQYQSSRLKAGVHDLKNHVTFTVCKWCFVLRFYGPVNIIMVMSSQSVNISTLFLGRLPKQLTSTKCPYFWQQLTTAQLESVVGKEWL